VNLAQRVVVVIALGIGLFVVAAAVSFLTLDRVDGGWFAYAPNTGVTLEPSQQTDTYYVVPTDRAMAEQAGIWLLALVTWAGASLWLLRTRSKAVETVEATDRP
jgi:hypothetical protein